MIVNTCIDIGKSNTTCTLWGVHGNLQLSYIAFDELERKMNESILRLAILHCRCPDIILLPSFFSFICSSKKGPIILTNQVRYDDRCVCMASLNYKFASLEHYSGNKSD